MKKILIILLFPIICQAQGFKTVPDSLRCITPSQVSKHIEDAFTIKQMGQSLLFLDSANISLEYSLTELKQVNGFYKSQINLHLLINSNLQDDKDSLTEQLTLANRKIKLQKVLIYIVGSIGATTTTYFIFH